jgi:hypothetical protein
VLIDQLNQQIDQIVKELKAGGADHRLEMRHRSVPTATDPRTDEACLARKAGSTSQTPVDQRTPCDL